MRKCIRCGKEMIEDLGIVTSNGCFFIEIGETGIFKDRIEPLKCAVCPDCGYVETYVDDTYKIIKFDNKRKS